MWVRTQGFEFRGNTKPFVKLRIVFRIREKLFVIKMRIKIPNGVANRKLRRYRRKIIDIIFAKKKSIFNLLRY